MKCPILPSQPSYEALVLIVTKPEPSDSRGLESILGMEEGSATLPKLTHHDLSSSLFPLSLSHSPSPSPSLSLLLFWKVHRRVLMVWNSLILMKNMCVYWEAKEATTLIRFLKDFGILVTPKLLSSFSL